MYYVDELNFSGSEFYFIESYIRKEKKRNEGERSEDDGTF